MAYPNPPAHFRITWSGTFGTAPGVEIWSFGLSAAGGTVLTTGVGNPEAFYESVTAALSNDWLIAAGWISTAARLTRTRMAAIGDDGLTQRDTAGAYRQGDDFTVRQAQGTHAGHPPQVAMAVTTRSAFAGPTGRGRYYLPAPTAVTEVGTMRLSETTRDGVALSQANFLNAVNTTLAAADAGLRLVLASGGSLLKGLPPANHTLTEIGVGKALDTIRTRRNALDEGNEYVSLA